MKRLISLWLVSCLFSSQVFAHTSNVEHVDSFSSEITIQKDTSIRITENIEYFTPQEKHGIYRYIPVKYNRNGLSYSTTIRDIDISDPFLQSHIKGNIEFKIGQADKTFSGSKTYQISYTTENAVNRFQTYDELYWDIVGEGWQFPINKTATLINSPYAEILEIICFSGSVGSNDNLCQAKLLNNKQAQVIYNQPIEYGGNVTVAVKLNQNNSAIVFPTRTQKLIKVVGDNGLWVFMFLPTIVMFLIWNQYGRDYVFLSDNIYNTNSELSQKKKGICSKSRIPLHYEPFEDITPGEAGALLDERVDNQDIVAEIVDLARKKFIKIESVKDTGIIFKKVDYLFTQIDKPKDHLVSHQQYLLKELFKSGDKVKLSELKGNFHTAMSQLKHKIFSSTLERKFFTSHPTTARVKAFLGAIAMLGGTYIGGSWLDHTDSPLPFVLVLVQLPSAFLFVRGMVQKSALGSSYFMRVRGLRETIRKGKWREQIKEKRLFIEEILPFAVSLGVVNKLTKEMEVLNIKPPDYISTVTSHHLSASGFINSFTSQTAQSLSYNPSSSSYSGGSGFSGGSSGGGGGGGGGGSW